MREITAAQLRERIENGEKLTIIDVREDHEVAEGIVPGAIHIRLGDLEHRHTEIQPAGELFFVCRGGRRSLKACEWLLSNGYTGLMNVAGGMTAWKELR
ncbi:rhodanese-like domain-containing protein [Paenibacillus sp. WQ 127069]|uniref:Rhodanese-like domain-containing protein n=1 Tax=Paenibacillus baimaensis TaxID=2982185 RepID=A0ABT2USF4_9BACL|nr:rhodanese-like domain-containing protein [Paenibacillus sp. WQ 127069]MCU6797567.1 rhodanese-like domain-containing protein [Paenibacillus sp. WQ 127069]